MLQPGDRVPEARVWIATLEGPTLLSDALAGDGPALLCFYVLDWSPG